MKLCIPSAAPYSQCHGKVQLMVTGSEQAMSKVHHILFKLSDFQEESWTTAFFPQNQLTYVSYHNRAVF